MSAAARCSARPALPACWRLCGALLRLDCLDLAGPRSCSPAGSASGLTCWPDLLTSQACWTCTRPPHPTQPNPTHPRARWLRRGKKTAGFELSFEFRWRAVLGGGGGGGAVVTGTAK